MGLLLASASLGTMAQDSLYIKYTDRFQENKALFATKGIDSVEVLRNATTAYLRRYSTSYTKGYQDYRLSLTNTDGSSKGMLVLGNPGRILWKPRTSDNSYNNDYLNPGSKWCFAHSRESEHFVAFWDSKFGDDPNASSVPSWARVDIDDLLKKAEQFYNTNVNVLQMATVGQGKSRLDHYKMAIYMLYPDNADDWLATGAGNDYVVGTLWVKPRTCHPVGSTIAHEVGHTFQYQVYCDQMLNGGSRNKDCNFQYTIPGAQGNGFWEQCAQWQSFQDYPQEAITTYDFNVWIANHHRHFEHEWQRYASYWEQYYWTEKYGKTALSRVWKGSRYPNDANQTYMKVFLNNNYDTLRAQLFEYAQKTATFDFDAVRRYVTPSTTDNYTVSWYSAGDGWKQIAYSNCVQPTGFNVIKCSDTTEGHTVNFHIKGLPAGSALAKYDPGKQVDGDGKTVATVKNYNSTDVAGHEGWAYGFVAYLSTGERVYGKMNLLEQTGVEATASFTVPANTLRLYVVVQGSPTEYRQCPWDEKESTDDQLPYLYKID